MAKVQIKYERITPFGGIFHVRELFSRFVGPVIDKVLGLRCTSFGYQYSEIAGSLASVYFCGGDCVEDVTSHLMPHLSLHPTLRTCILTNDYTSTNREIVEFYNLRGGKERIFDDMNNGFGWARLPKSFMAESTVFLLLTAMIRRSALPLALARTSTSSLWAGWTQKPSDWRSAAGSRHSFSSSLQAKRHSRAHQRASQVDKNGKALSAEYLHGQQIISEPFCIH